MLLTNSKHENGFSVITAEELFTINGGSGNATKYTFDDGSYMVVSNNGSFETKHYYANGSEKKFSDGYCMDVSGAKKETVNYNPSTGKIENNSSSSSSSSSTSSPSGGSSGSSSGGKS